MSNVAGVIGMLSLPGMLPALLLTGSIEGGSHGGRNTAAILAFAVPINLLFYFAVALLIRLGVRFLVNPGPTN